MSAGACLRRISAVAVLACAIAGVLVPVTAARAAVCPNESIRERESYAPALPDCRAYEQVSPVDKNLTDAAGDPGLVQAAPSGEAVSYFSVSPFPGTNGSPGQAPTYVGARSPEGWSIVSLVPPATPGSTDNVRGLSEDLADSVVLDEEPSEAETPVYDAYVLDAASGASRLLAANLGTYKFSFADATPGDAYVLFEAKAQLTASATPSGYNVYEWSEATGALTLVSALSDGEAPAGGAVAGPGGPAVPQKPGGSIAEFYTQDTISENGARVFFTASKSGVIYMREPEAGRTVQVSAGGEPAYWRAATPSGSFVLYTEGEDLYRFNVARFERSSKPEAEALAEAREPIASGAAGVLGTLGMSDDGSYVYFVAAGDLASNTNGNGEQAEAGADNLYEWHDPTSGSIETTFIAELLGPNGRSKQDEPDWRDYYGGAFESGGPSGGEKSSRVTPSGQAVLFSSVAALTGYENAGQTELYLYDGELAPSPDNPVCVSCSPTRESAISGAYLTSANETLTTTPSLRNAFLTRNLSEDGDRVFFQTEEPLLTTATNGQMNVYEWERAGAYPAEPDSCEPSSPTFAPGSGGCLYLISTGQSDAPSYFGDAGADGDDVFFFTRQSLVGQDRDENADLYDARVAGGLAAQNPLPAPAPCAEESCRPPYVSGPVFSPPASLTVTGAVAVEVDSTSSRRSPLTRAQRLARALRACRRRPARRRRACETRARRRYGRRRR